jgi:uncharacterized membrane protein
MDVNFNCPTCNQDLVADDQYAGGKVECPSCGGTATIPGSPGFGGASTEPSSFLDMALTGDYLPKDELTWTSLIKPAFMATFANLGALLAPIMVIGLVQGVVGAIPYVGSLAQIFITGPFSVSVAIITLKVVRGQDTGMSDFGSGFSYFGPALGAYVLMGLIGAGMGLVAFLPAMIFPGWVYVMPFAMIPMVVVMMGFSLTYWIVYDRDTGPWESMMESWNMLKGYKGTLFGMFFLLGLINIAGALCLFVGLIFTVPITYVAIAMFYETLNRAEQRHVSTAAELALE